MFTRPSTRFASILAVVAMTTLVPLATMGTANAGAPVQVNMTLEGCKLPDLASSCTLPDDLTTGSLGKNWAELDLVPHRLTLDNNGAAQTFELRLSADHLLGTVKGYDFITTPTLTSGGPGCSFIVLDQNTVSPSGVVGGVDKVLTTQLQVTMAVDATCVIDYKERLALGSHLYSGASLQSQVLEADYDSIGQRTVSIPVNEIAPQEISKTATANTVPSYSWTVGKTSPTTGVTIDSCLPAPTTTNVTYTVSYTRTKTDGASINVSGIITLTNPAHRALTATVTDTIKRAGVSVGGGALPPVVVPAAVGAVPGTQTVPYSYAIANGTGTLTNEASAVYSDPDIPGAFLTPLSVVVAVPFSPIELPGVGDTAVITDTETASSGLAYSRSTPQATSGFVSTDSFLTNVSASGSFGISKIIKATAPGNFVGSLTNDVSLDPDGPAGAQTAQVVIPITVTAAMPVLTIDKRVDVAPTSSTTFNFTITNNQTNATTNASVTLAGGSTGNTTAVTVAPSNSGYTVTELTPPAGYDLAGPVQAASLALCASGTTRVDNVRSRATLTVTKAVSGDAAPPAGFVFHVSCTDGTTATLTFHGAGSQSVTGIQTGSDCDVTEDAAPGWTSSPSGTQTVTVTNGGATVAFTNTRNTGTVSVSKAISGDDAPAAGFVFSVTCNDGTDATLTFGTSGTQSVGGILAGSLCTVTETAAPGWTSTPSGPQTATLPLTNGSTTTFSFTNTRNTGAVSLTKTVTGDDAPAAGFVFTVVCNDGTDETLTFHSSGTQSVDGILAGSTCTVTETAVAGWSAVPATAQTVTLPLTNGSSTSVSFANSRNVATLSIAKAIVGDTAPAAGFVFSVTCDDGTDETLTFTESGTQTVHGILSGSTCTATETPVEGWTSEPLTQTVTLGLADGSTATLSFTNTRNTGSLAVTKAISGDVAPEGGFVFSVSCNDGTTETLTFTEEGTKTVDGILAGSTCTVSETPADGWTSAPPSQTVVLPMTDDSTTTVSFTNTRNTGTVSVTKAIEGEDAPADGFTFSVTCDDGTDVTLTFHDAGTQSVTGILSGSTCTVSETAVEGWTSTPAGPQEVTLELADGATATVSFTNTRQPAGLELVKTVDKATARFGDTLVYGLTVTNTGERPLHNVVVDDDVPAKTTYVAGSATCAAPCTASYDASDNTVHFAIGDLDAGDSYGGMSFKVTITRPAPAADGAIAGVTILNTAVTSSTPDVDPVRSNEVKTTVTAVLGVKLTRPELPRTGNTVPLNAALSWALALLIGGAGLTFAGSRREDDAEA